MRYLRWLGVRDKGFIWGIIQGQHGVILYVRRGAEAYPMQVGSYITEGLFLAASWQITPMEEL